MTNTNLSILTILNDLLKNCTLVVDRGRDYIINCHIGEEQTLVNADKFLED